jgi:hypothetical protein
MRKILMAGAIVGLMLGVAVPIKATALTLGPANLTAPTVSDSMVIQVQRRGRVAWRGPRRAGVAWRGPRRAGVAWRRGWVRPGWRVGWVGPGYYYNPAFYNRYYNPRWGYCRIVWWNGARVCRWHRRPWW